MRWEALFDDLEAQAAAVAAADLAAEVADRTRLEYARLRLADRLPARLGATVALRVQHLGPVTGELRRVGPDWLLVAVPPGGTELVLASAWLVSIDDLGPAAEPPGRRGLLAERLDLRYALRRLVRERSPVRLTLADGWALDGTIDRVGTDHLDLAEHPPDEPRRAAAVRAVHTVALAAVVAVRAR
jgi:hypothetical protein